MNIACSFPNCTNPVIGQCTGYKGECRKYYCATHSSETLCHQCASKKLAEENEALAKQEFLKLIDGMRNDARSISWRIFWGRKESTWGIWIILFLGLIGAIIAVNVNNDVGVLFLGAGGLGIVIGIFSLLSEISNQEKILATNIDQQKNGFLDFFAAWKIEKQKKNLATIGTIVGFIFVIMIAALASGSKNNSDDDD